ncbi:flagellar hook assembly protein FlgD [Nocardioides deserti]|uniref:Flagellar hook capping protein n=1 Tax=Nocardioides deserti TaxID=1588644 RepID=A0ABR6UD85_9ACTN|nr:flagellar hook capping FlgD N-terminal domain-containing protein [Nocardioides deserti]MBC2962417.1 flagellar hook capping protein [Nocardioides deserti]GGO77962.1 flagellar hook capping protein [Nocardioides deserti]
MSITPTEGVAPTSVFAPQQATSTGSSADKDMFLQLMVAQMKYQDPMNPTDSSQFLSQTAQFTALEKMQEVADQTALLLGASLAFGASGMVGRTVTYGHEDGTTGTGTVTGVTFGAGGPVLDVDGTEVPLSLVQQVRDTAAPIAPGSPTDATD